MGDSHRHLAITEDEWAAFMDDLQQALAKFQVPGPEEQALVEIVEGTREAIVVMPPLEAGPPRP
jgi:hemoglobin